MKINFIPVCLPQRDKGSVYRDTYILLHRKNERPIIIMRKTTINSHHFSYDKSVFELQICGEFVNGFSFNDLQENDTIFVPSESYSDVRPMTMNMYPTDSVLLPFNTDATVLGIASGLERNKNVIMFTPDAESIVEHASTIHTQAQDLYHKYPAYGRIMMKEDGEIKAYSLTHLAAKQEESVQSVITNMFLTLTKSLNSSVTVANRILDQIQFEENFQLLTQEEQVEHFIEFSRLSANSKREYVSDELIENIKNSDEYRQMETWFTEQELGMSATQQFNVLQQVGFLSSNHYQNNIMYNLSDMGAGKTLMTVEAICLMDMKTLATIPSVELPDGLTIDTYWVPNKHIIAPTLSIKSSWINTFKMFYDVEEVDDMTYILTLEYNGVVAKSMIYVASFTMKHSQMFVHSKLPEATYGTYLIIDEIHQIVGRNIAKTKFFPPKTSPVSTYKIFVLSGTLSNLKTSQWYNFLRFMDISTALSTPQAAKAEIDSQRRHTVNALNVAATEIRTTQHREFDCEKLTADNTYRIEGNEKTSAVEVNFFTQYGSQIITAPRFYEEDEAIEVESFLVDQLRQSSICVDQSEIDTTNFQLFYTLVGSQAITAQSSQVAEELFGEQKTQHTSDIIKTVSPLSDTDVKILKTLHHIAEAHGHYKSVSIAKAINTAILNLNDGLQTKNIYDIVSHYAEKNLRFFEYLSTLDLNILEQLPQSGLIAMPKLEDTDKFKILQDILQREKDETHLIVVNDFFALRALSKALGIEHITKPQLAKELDYQEILDELFEKQSIVVVTQDMIKSSLDLVQANRLIQYQLNTEISDIIQTQNRINRIGQTRETRGYYIASDALQENLIELFISSYRNIRVAHKGIVELFVDITSQINIINNYLDKALYALSSDTDEIDEIIETVSDVVDVAEVPEGSYIVNTDNKAQVILYPQDDRVRVLAPLDNGNAFPLGYLTEDAQVGITESQLATLDLETYTLCTPITQAACLG